MWLLEYGVWCAKWDSFLRESTFKDGRKVYTHECLRRARRSFNGLVRGKILFTFVEMQHELGGTWPSINNAVESVNARLRDMLRHYRGLSLPLRQGDLLVALHVHGSLLPAAEILWVIATDDDVDGCSPRLPAIRGEGMAYRTNTERGSCGRSFIYPRTTGSE